MPMSSASAKSLMTPVPQTKNARMLSSVAPEALPGAAAEARRASRLSRKLRGKVERERAGWAELLERVFGVHGYRCPQCAGPLVLRTIVLHPQTTRKILKGLERARGPPPGVCAGEDREA